MSEPTNDEYRDWKDLLESPGWARLKAYVESEMSPASIEQHVMKALDSQDADAVSKLRQMVAAKRWVLKALAYPDSRINTLKPFLGEPPEHLGRRGAL